MDCKIHPVGNQHTNPANDAVLSGGIDGARMKAGLLDASLKKIAKTVGAAFVANKAIAFGKILIDVRAV